MNLKGYAAFVESRLKQGIIFSFFAQECGDCGALVLIGGVFNGLCQDLLLNFCLSGKSLVAIR